LRYSPIYNDAIYNPEVTPVDNPFTYGLIVTGKYFTDRAAELAELEES